VTTKGQIGSRLLLAGGGLSALASLVHVGIILGGPDWYRFFGAGERMARLASRGSVYPAAFTASIAFALAISSLYALSGAGMIRPLPLLRQALVFIAAVYLFRGMFGIPVVLFLEDPYTNELRLRMTFMMVTSFICVCLGLCYVVGAGLVQPRKRA